MSIKVNKVMNKVQSDFLGCKYRADIFSYTLKTIKRFS